VAEPLELHDIQGNILNGYAFDHALYLFLGAASTVAARRCLRSVVHRVTTAERWPSGVRPRTTLNVAITFTGFTRLGLPRTLLGRFPAAFAQPTRERAKLLGDVGCSDPALWEDELGTGTAHLLLMVSAQTEEELGEAREGLGRLVAEADGELTVVHEQPAHAIPRMREHFGYADGLSQPDIEGVPRSTRRRGASTRGDGVPLKNLRWRPLKAGEFVLGYPDEDGQVATEPDPGLVRNGSYMVYRKLYQDVARFRRGLQEAAEQSNLSEELIAAKVVGRWRDGVALELDPDRDPGDLTQVEAETVSNDFRYLPHDRRGYACPAGAHIRRTNPRDALGFDGLLTARHRIVRRGLPYGPPLAPGTTTDDGVDRGLVFVCFNADIERQFEIVQGQWCNDGNAFGLGDDRDYLLANGGGTGKMTIPVRGSWPRFVDTQPDIVVTRGAEYLFAPGIRALHRLASGAPEGPAQA